MSNETSQDLTNHENPTTTGHAAETPPARFRIGTVLKVVVPVALLGVGALAFFGIFDGPQWIANLMAPARVVVSGQVLFNSEPLAGAVIATRPVQGGLRGAIGTTDEKGRFKLVTEVNGDFLEGAFVGEHQVTIKGYHDIPSMGEKPLLTPEEYASFDTSPLRISVSAAQHELTIELTGTPSARPPGPGFVPGSQRPPPPGKERGGVPKGNREPQQESTTPTPAANTP